MDVTSAQLNLSKKKAPPALQFLIKYETAKSTVRGMGAVFSSAFGQVLAELWIIHAVDKRVNNITNPPY